jgi:hypothetical protein
MWNELTTLLTGFPTAVLTALDENDQPASVRVTPTPDHTTGLLRGPLPPGLGLRPGPACLLCHRHDTTLWTLRSFLIRGHLTTTPTHWILTPHTLTRGQGLGGPLADARTFLTARRRATAYLHHRKLTPPPIPWDQIRRPQHPT